MTKYLYTNILGTFIFDQSFRLVDAVKFFSINDYEKSKKEEDKLNKKYKDLIPVKETDAEIIKRVLDHFRINLNEYKEIFYKHNLSITKTSIKGSVNNSLLIIQCSSSIEELDKVINTLVKRLREWYSYYLPEISEEMQDNEAFAKIIAGKSRAEIFKKLNLNEDLTMGFNLDDDDFEPINSIIEEVNKLYALRMSLQKYLDKIMTKTCPNITAVAGTQIGAKLIAHAGSLERMSKFPASTIQLLGAEKALFRHMKTGAKSPKHGIIIQHPLLVSAKQKDKGKVARAIADKICIAAKVDYFQGEFVGDQLREKLEKRFKK